MLYRVVNEKDEEQGRYTAWMAAQLKALDLRKAHPGMLFAVEYDCKECGWVNADEAAGCDDCSYSFSHRSHKEEMAYA